MVGLLLYICRVKPLLRNPVYHSLLYNDSHLGTASGKVAYFDEAVSPFVGFAAGYEQGFEDLHEVLPTGRSILYATTQALMPPGGWQLKAAITGLQFLFEGAVPASTTLHPTKLEAEHVPQMMALAALTRPGPFGPRTIEFGHYYGVFVDDQLVAMTGQRLHVQDYTEISAVCTHPDHLGKGYASALVQHQVGLIVAQGQIPFLHVRADNQRAIEVYERLQFKRQGPMNFYFLQK